MDEGKVRGGFEPGTIVAGKYRIDRTLAEGGMGFVVAGTHLHLEQPVALKFLREGIHVELDALARFTREAKAAAQLRSEYVARVLDAGVTADGTPYMAMEYLEGESLASSLQRQGPLDVASAAEYVIQACEGLAEAHARGIIHRDIKPYNLFLVERAPGWRAIKILDFGISKITFAEATNISTRVIIGSPCYMSPEQLRSTATVDHRTDIWSLGATLHELLSGGTPFDASMTLPEIIASILTTPALSLNVVRPGVPEELAAIVARCLAKDRRARFANAGELAMALLPFAPPRARVPAERAASLKPAVAVASSDFEAESEPACDEDWSEAEAIASLVAETPVPLGRASATNATNATSKRDGARSSNRESLPAPKRETVSPPKRQSAGSTAPLAITLHSGDPARQPEKIKERSGATRQAKRRAAAGVAGVAVLAAMAWLHASRGPRDGAVKFTSAPPVLTSVAAVAARPSVPAPPVEEPPAARPAPPSPASRAELVVRVSPPFARLSVDDKPVANPFRASYASDEARHRIAARAWGYETKSEDVSVSADTVVELALERRTWAANAVVSPPIASPKDNRVASEVPAQGARPSPRPGVAAGLTEEVDTAGGRAPLRPIDAKDPYGSP